MRCASIGSTRIVSECMLIVSECMLIASLIRCVARRLAQFVCA